MACSVKNVKILAVAVSFITPWKISFKFSLYFVKYTSTDLLQKHLYLQQFIIFIYLKFWLAYANN